MCIVPEIETDSGEDYPDWDPESIQSYTESVTQDQGEVFFRLLILSSTTDELSKKMKLPTITRTLKIDNVEVLEFEESV